MRKCLARRVAPPRAGIPVTGSRSAALQRCRDVGNGSLAYITLHASGDIFAQPIVTVVLIVHCSHVQCPRTLYFPTPSKAAIPLMLGWLSSGSRWFFVLALRLLFWLGFRLLGVQKGSYAARAQSHIGNVLKGSLFARAQSFSMRG